MNKGFKKIEDEKIIRELGHFTQEELLGHRFRLPQEGKDIRNGIRELFTQQHRLYPEFVGVGFLGSQIKGYAKPDSDWDLNLLFDEGKKQYSDISDSLTPVNRAFEEFAGKNNIVFGKDYSYPEVKFSVYDGARLSRDMSDLLKNLNDQRDDELRTVILDGYVKLFLPYIGDMNEIKRIRKEFFDALHVESGKQEVISDKMWEEVVKRLFVLENVRTIPKDSNFSNHPRYNLYPHTYKKARQYFLGQK